MTNAHVTHLPLLVQPHLCAWCIPILYTHNPSVLVRLHLPSHPPILTTTTHPSSPPPNQLHHHPPTLTTTHPLSPPPTNSHHHPPTFTTTHPPSLPPTHLHHHPPTLTTTQPTLISRSSPPETKNIPQGDTSRQLTDPSNDPSSCLTSDPSYTSQ